MMAEGEGVKLMGGDGGRRDMVRQWEKEKERPRGCVRQNVKHSETEKQYTSELKEGEVVNSNSHNHPHLHTHLLILHIA